MSDDPRLEAARRRRDEILTQERWLDGAEVLRAGAPLFQVWDDREYRVPAFQVDATGKMVPRLPELLALLPDDRSGWRQMMWLCQPHARLGGRTPSDVFRSDPAAVIEAARRTYHPDDRDW